MLRQLTGSLSTSLLITMVVMFWPKFIIFSLVSVCKLFTESEIKVSTLLQVFKISYHLISVRDGCCHVFGSAVPIA
jgi:hypothetical protein